MSKNNSIFVVITGLILGICRIVLGKIDIYGQSTLLVMAVVNYIAFGCVILFLCNDVVKFCDQKIKNSGIDTSIKQKRKSVKQVIFFYRKVILLLLYFLFGIIYIKDLKSNDYNDALSIVALIISISSNGLVDIIGEHYYQLIIKKSSKGKEVSL